MKNKSILILKELKKDMTCLDVGGNIGYYTLLESNIVGEHGKVIAIEVKKADKITIATFIKLLAINIVANSLFGFCNNCKTSLCNLSLSISSISVGLNEKKATSDPEIKAEKIININIIANEVIA